MSDSTLGYTRKLATEVRLLREEVKILTEANLALRARMGETRNNVEETVAIIEKEGPLLSSVVYPDDDDVHAAVAASPVRKTPLRSGVFNNDKPFG